MTAKLQETFRALNTAGIWVTVPVAEISCISADDDETDCTLLTLLDQSVVMLPEAYEDVMDRIVATWPDHK